MDRAALQKIEDTCDNALISIDELAPASPDRLVEGIVRDGGQNVESFKPTKISDLVVSVKLMQTELNTLEEHIETICDMIASPAEGDESFVEDESQAARTHRIKLSQALDRVIDFAKYNELTKNNTTLAMISENVDIVCKSVDSVVNDLNKMYER